MLQFNIRYLLLVLPTFLLFSCEDVVDLPVDSQSELVVFSNFSDQNGLEVYVYKTRSILTNEPTEYIKDAVVKVYKGDELLEELAIVQPLDPQQNPPFYRTNHLVPEFDVEYTIEVKVEGYKTISAKNSIPTPVNLEAVTFDPSVSAGIGEEVNVDFDISVSLQDPANIENFYHLKFYQELTPYTISAVGDTILGNPYLAFPTEVNEVNENDPPVKYESDQSFLMEDVQFDGQYITLAFTGAYSFDPSKTLGRFKIELRTVSRAYYLYHDSLNRQNRNGNQFGNGVVVFNNIDNGVGNFSGFTSKVNSFRLTD